MTMFQRFLKDESGATAIEYGLLAALIGVAIIAGASTAGGALDSMFDTVGTCMTTARDAAGAPVTC